MFRAMFIVTLLALRGAALAQDDDSRLALFTLDSPDPTAIEVVDGNEIYVFTTGRGTPIFRSTSLFDFQPAGRVFADNVPAWARTAIPEIKPRGGIWAPDITHNNGLYRVYYSVSTFGSQRSVIGLAVNKTLDQKSPDYRWEDRGLVLESAPNKTDYNAIDAAHFIDDDGKTYLFWGSFWSGIKGVEVDPQTGMPREYVGGDLKIPRGYRHIAGRRDASDTSIEAAFVIRRGKFYYLMVSWGTCCDKERSTYRIAYGRSESPLGPYVDRDGKPLADGGGTLLLESTDRWKGTGHNGVLTTRHLDHRGKPSTETTSKENAVRDWLILAAYDVNNLDRNRLTQIRPLTITEDGWLEVGEVCEREAREQWRSSIGHIGPI
ncbi:MAG: arabinan endo-1,5-alpha-L-arabinosidase [Thermoguttaceae bacterium]